MNSQSNLLTNFAVQFFVPASRGINWQFAIATALDSSQNIPLTQRKEINNLYNEALDIIEPLIAKTSGLKIKQPSQLVICDRHEWLVNTGDNLSVMFDKTFGPIFDILEKQPSNNMVRKVSQSVITTQVGMLLGLLSTKVLGQFDAGAPGTKTSNLVFVIEPNIIQREIDLGLQRSPFRLWILAHELTHNLQFQNFSWIKQYYDRLIQKFADSVTDKLSKSRSTTEATLNLLVNKESWLMISQIQAFMSFIEGYADFVMFQIGKLLPNFKQLEPVFRRQKRPDEPLLKKILEKIFGFDMKANQYKQGLKFVSQIAELESLSFLNSNMDSPEKLPTTQELTEPELWLRRIDQQNNS